MLIVVHGHWQILFEKLIHHTSIEEAVRRYADRPIPNASVTAYRSMAHLRRGREGLVRFTEEPVVPWEGKI